MLRTYQPKKLHRKASERECLQPTVEKYWLEEELKVEKGCLTKEQATLLQWSFFVVCGFYFA